MPTVLSGPRAPGFQLVPALAWTYFFAYAAWSVLMLAGLVPRGIVNDLVALPMSLGAAWCGFRAGAARRDEPRLARGWLLVGLAWLCSSVGSALLVVNIWSPTPAADLIGRAVYNLYYPLCLFGLWHFFEMPPRGDSRLRLLVECLIVAAAAVVLAWYFVFRFDEATRSLGPFLKTIGFVVLSELLLMVGASAVLHRPAPHADGPSLTVFGIAVFAAAIADLLYQQSVLVASSWTAPTADLLLGFAGTLVTWAAWLTWTRRPATEGGVPGVAVGLTLLPYLAVGVVAALLVFESTSSGLGAGPIGGLVVGGGMLSLLVILRLLVAQREFVHEATARAAQDARFRSLVDRSSDGILVVSATGRIEYASPAVTRIVGAPMTELDGRLLADFVRPDQQTAVDAWLRASGERPVGEWQLGRPGAWLDVEAVATDLTQDPLVSGIVLNLRDVTERIRLEADLVQAQKLELVGRLSSSVAHDFNNLLTIIIGNLRLARLSGAKGGSADLQAVEAAAHRGAALARQLLSLSRPTEVSLTVVDLASVVRALEPTMRTVLPSSITMVVTSTSDRTPVTLDDAQTEQVLLNLALNARDAMPTGGRLEVSVDTEVAGWVCLSVSDTGTGMSDEAMAHAFEPFFTTKSRMGTGLGLSTVRRIAMTAGGDVQIASRPGSGTIVRFRLPLVAEPEQQGEASSPPPVSGAGHILVVDDEPAVRRLLVQQLTQTGYQVSDASDGAMALARLRAAVVPVDLVLTDLVMPNMSGEALARQMSREFPLVPVLCMSGTPGLATGSNEPWSVDQVIAKPADVDVVAHRIARALALRSLRSAPTP